MACSQPQAEIISNRLFAMPVNRDHCKAWVKENLSSLQASEIVGKVINLRYSTPKDEADVAWSWGRQRLTELGYVPLESSKSN